MARDGVRSVLVASDLSDRSDAIVRAAGELAGQTGAALHVLHAVEALDGRLREASFDLVGLQRVLHDARLALHDQVRRVLPQGVSASSVRLDHRAAAPAILQRAREVEADLIVVGPHRARVPGSHVLGTTAQRVVEEAAVPCLVTGGPLPSPLRRVLLPVGGLDVRRGLLAAAGSWLAGVQRQQATPAAPPTELRVLHVVGDPREWREFSDELARELRSLGEVPAVAAHLEVRRSIAWSQTPAAEIVQVAGELEVDVVAMGVRGHGPLMRALLGSVSSAVLRRAAAPVLLFPPRMCEAWLARPEPPAWLAASDTLRDPDLDWHRAYVASDEDEPEASAAEATC